MNPFTPATIAPLAQQFGTPLWIYDADTITRQIAALRLFDVVRFAQKANSNTHILRLMKRQVTCALRVCRHWPMPWYPAHWYISHMPILN